MYLKHFYGKVSIELKWSENGPQCTVLIMSQKLHPVIQFHTVGPKELDITTMFLRYRSLHSPSQILYLIDRLKEIRHAVRCGNFLPSLTGHIVLEGNLAHQQSTPSKKAP